MINAQQWRYWKMMTIIPFISVNKFVFSIQNSIVFCLYVFTVIMTYWMNLSGGGLVDNCFIYACYNLDSLVLNSFILATIE